MFNVRWQRCLSQLRTDPQAAQTRLYNILCDQFETRPPRHLDLWIDAGRGESCEEFIHRLYVHLCEDDFKRLRKGPVVAPPPPEGWLRTVAAHRILDDLKPVRPKTVDLLDWEVIDGPRDIDVLRTVSGREAARIVLECLARLRDKDRLLAEGRAEERSAAELAMLLGWKNTRRNRKRAADAADYAISNLMKLIKVKNEDLYYQLYARKRIRRVFSGVAL